MAQDGIGVLDSVKDEFLYMPLFYDNSQPHMLVHYNGNFSSAKPFSPLHRAGKNGCVPRSVEKERRPPLRHQSIISGGNLRVFENLAQTLVAVDAS